MNYRIAAGATLAVALLVGCAAAEDGLKSGPQAGQKIPGPFHPLNVNGAAAGKKACQVWINGDNPVAMVFAREVSDSLTSLVKKLDDAAVKNKSCRMGSFVVFCTDDEGLKDKLKDLAEKEHLKKVILTIDNPSGPTSYKIAKDADVTVVLYEQREVKANYAFKKGELKDTDVEKIVQELAKILPEKKASE